MNDSSTLVNIENHTMNKAPVIQNGSLPSIRANRGAKRKRDVKDVLNFKPILYNVDTAGLPDEDPKSKFQQMQSLKKKLDHVNFLTPDKDNHVKDLMTRSQPELAAFVSKRDRKIQPVIPAAPPPDKTSFYL